MSKGRIEVSKLLYPSRPLDIAGRDWRLDDRLSALFEFYPKRTTQAGEAQVVRILRIFGTNYDYAH